MQKYRETKDLEKVRAARSDGLAVDAEEVWGAFLPVDILEEHYICWAERRDIVPSKIDRVFRIEIPRPTTAPDGWVVLDPGDDADPFDKVFDMNGLIDKDYSLIVPSGKQSPHFWYARKIKAKPEAPKRRLERVGLFRDVGGALCYRPFGDGDCLRCRHALAVSEKGFEHYIYEDGLKAVAPVRIVSDNNLRVFPVAFERWVEEE
jgi:hypothetical protein